MKGRGQEDQLWRVMISFQVAKEETWDAAPVNEPFALTFLLLPDVGCARPRGWHGARSQEAKLGEVWCSLFADYGVEPFLSPTEGFFAC